MSAVEVLSLIAYAPRIGFYWDDWIYLSFLKSCPSQGFWGLYGCLYSDAPTMHPRPVQIFCLAALYKLTGLHPLGYQLFIAVLLVATVSMFYIVLRELQVPRLFALSVPMVYGLLPHYSTDRFWMAASQSLVSMFFGFLCFYCILRSASADRARMWWPSGAFVAFLVSAFAYEAFVPFVLFAPVLYWYRGKLRSMRGGASGSGFRRGVAAYSIAAAVLLIAISAYKVVAMPRFHWSFLHRMPYVIYQGLFRAFNFNFGYYGLGLPVVAWNAIRFYPDSESLILAALLVVAILGYFFWVARSSQPRFPGRAAWTMLLGLGLVVFGLGYAPFFAYPTLYLTSTDPGNRIAIAAAVGAAILIVALLGWVASLAGSDQIRTGIFAFLVMIFAVSGFMIVNAIGGFWVAANRKQNSVLASIQRKFPVLPPASTLILDGVCYSIGPAPVFAFDYDLGGALSIKYGDPNLSAEVVSPAMKVGEDGLTSAAWDYATSHNYSSNLIIFDLRQNITEHLTSAEVARRYFQAHDPTFNGEWKPARASPSIYPFKKDGFAEHDCSEKLGAR